mgnify:CR=1 FL=1
MLRPQHLAFCQSTTPPEPSCPACAWDAAVEATLAAVGDHLRHDWYQPDRIIEQLQEWVREKLKRRN